MTPKNTVQYESAEQMWECINLFQKNGNSCIDGFTWNKNGVIQMWDNFKRDTVIYGENSTGDPVWEFDFNRKRDDDENIG